MYCYVFALILTLLTATHCTPATLNHALAPSSLTSTPVTPHHSLTCMPVDYVSQLVQSAGGQHIMLHILNHTAVPDWVDLHYQLSGEVPQNIRLSSVTHLQNDFLVNTLRQLHVPAALAMDNVGGTPAPADTTYFTHNYPVNLQPGQIVTHSYTLGFRGVDCDTAEQSLQQPPLPGAVQLNQGHTCSDLTYTHKVDATGNIVFNNLAAYRYPMSWIEVHVQLNNDTAQKYRLVEHDVIQTFGSYDIQTYVLPNDAAVAKPGDTVSYSFTTSSLAGTPQTTPTQAHAGLLTNSAAAQLLCDTPTFESHLGHAR